MNGCFVCRPAQIIVVSTGLRSKYKLSLVLNFLYDVEVYDCTTESDVDLQ